MAIDRAPHGRCATLDALAEMTTLQASEPAGEHGNITISTCVDLVRDTPSVRRQRGPRPARDELLHDVVLRVHLDPIRGRPDACIFQRAPLSASEWVGSLGPLLVLAIGSLRIEPHSTVAVVRRWSRAVRGRVRELRERRGSERREQV